MVGCQVRTRTATLQRHLLLGHGEYCETFRVRIQRRSPSPPAAILRKATRYQDALVVIGIRSDGSLHGRHIWLWRCGLVLKFNWQFPADWKVLQLESNDKTLAALYSSICAANGARRWNTRSSNTNRWDVPLDRLTGLIPIDWTLGIRFIRFCYFDYLLAIIFGASIDAPLPHQKLEATLWRVGTWTSCCSGRFFFYSWRTRHWLLCACFGRLGPHDHPTIFSSIFSQPQQELAESDDGPVEHFTAINTEFELKKSKFN